MFSIPYPLRFVCFLLLCYLFPGALHTAETITDTWAIKLIPLPHSISVTESRLLSADQIVLAYNGPENAHAHMALEILQPFAQGSTGFEIKLALSNDAKNCPADLTKTLAGTANSQQAYAIEPIFNHGQFSGLLLAANHPIGLLYAGRTLRQLLSGQNTDRIEIPQVSILDWPDLEERGEWGWNLPHDRYSIAELKMNEVEIHSTLGFNTDGSASASLDQTFLSESQRLGIKVVPIIRHLEQLAKTGLFTFHPEVAALPDPNTPLPSDYQPAVCFSNPKSIQLIAGWMEQLLSLPGVDDINAWLAELPAPCFCEQCQGQNSFVLQTKSLIKAFELARKGHPGSHLRILLSQASFQDNDKVLAALTPETRVTYYSGQTTYDSSHKPMIYPLLACFARAGGWLGVYPQLTNSWRSQFPFTGPHFIKTRMNEFVDKGLHGFSGYATPANCYYDFNIAAAAEWSWNSKGRTPRQFAEAYANRIGLKQPDLFAQWADLIGETGWHLAGSRIVESLIFAAGGQIFIDGFIEDGVLFARDKPLQYGQGMLVEFADEKSLLHHIDRAEQALAVAEQADEPHMLLESRCVRNTLLFVRHLKNILDDLALQPLPIARLESQLDSLDTVAGDLTQAMVHWGALVNPVERELVYYRFRDSVDWPASIAGQVRNWAQDVGITDPTPAYRFQDLAGWQSQDFSDVADVTIWADVTDLLQQPGEYDVRLLFTDGASGVNTRAVTLLSGPTRETAQPLFVDRWDGRLSKYGRYLEYWITVPAKPANLANGLDRYYIKTELSGPALDLPQERRSSNGKIMLRKSWRDADSRR